jgi:hypothetical protein
MNKRVGKLQKFRRCTSICTNASQAKRKKYSIYGEMCFGVNPIIII